CPSSPHFYLQKFIKAIREILIFTFSDDRFPISLKKYFSIFFVNKKMIFRLDGKGYIKSWISVCSPTPIDNSCYFSIVNKDVIDGKITVNKSLTYIHWFFSF